MAHKLRFSTYYVNHVNVYYSVKNSTAGYEYRTRAIIGRSQFEAALVYKPRILGLKNEEFPFLVYKLSVI